MSEVNQQQRDMLERMIDDHGLSGVLEAIADVCIEKHDHIMSSYATNSFDQQAVCWSDAAGYLRGRAYVERKFTT